MGETGSTIDGNIINNLTIDGDEVKEVTADGNLVYKSDFSVDHYWDEYASTNGEVHDNEVRATVSGEYWISNPTDYKYVNKVSISIYTYVSWTGGYKDGSLYYRLNGDSSWTHATSFEWAHDTWNTVSTGTVDRGRYQIKVESDDDEGAFHIENGNPCWWEYG